MRLEAETEKKKANRVILDEEKEAENILSSPTGEIMYDKVFLIGKYFYSKGYSRKKVHLEILKYCEKSELFNVIFSSRMINYVLNKSKSYKLRKSNFKISITKKEVDVIKSLPHRYYRVALYMLFVAKMEKYQTFKKEKKAKNKSFRTYFNYDLESAMYSSGLPTSKKEIISMGEKLFDCGFGEPILGTYKWEIFIADFNSRDSEFVIDGDLDFESQIKYYCLQCGKKTEKPKKREYCDECYSSYRRNRKR